MQVEFEIDIGHPAVYMEQWLEIHINLIFIQVYNRKKYHYALPYWKHQTSDYTYQLHFLVGKKQQRE
jgi:hypothetical protein